MPFHLEAKSKFSQRQWKLRLLFKEIQCIHDHHISTGPHHLSSTNTKDTLNKSACRESIEASSGKKYSHLHGIQFHLCLNNSHQMQNTEHHRSIDSQFHDSHQIDNSYDIQQLHMTLQGKKHTHKPTCQYINSNT